MLLGSLGLRYCVPHGSPGTNVAMISDLPLNVLEFILQKLEAVDLAVLAQTGKSCRDAVRNNAKLMVVTSAGMLSRLGRKFPQLEVLDVEFSGYAYGVEAVHLNEQLMLALDSLPKLQELRNWRPEIYFNCPGSTTQSLLPHSLKRLSMRRQACCSNFLASKFGNLQDLELISLDASSVQILSGLGRLPELSSFKLSFSAAEGSQILPFEDWAPTLNPQKLTSLSLSRMLSTSSRFYEVLAQFTALSTLEVSHTRHPSDEGTLGLLTNLTGLTSLCLNGSNVSSHALSQLSTLTGVQQLGIAECFVTSPFGLSSVMKAFPNLTSLDLSGCRHVRSLPAGFQGLQNLTSLNISDCDNLTSFIFISSLTKLRCLFAGGAYTDRCQLQGLSALTSLTRLDLQSYTSRCATLVNASLAEISGLTTLEEISLRACYKLDGAALRHLAALPHLRLLDMRLTGITIDALEQLRETAIQKIRTMTFKLRSTAQGLRLVAPPDQTLEYERLPEIVRAALFRGAYYRNAEDSCWDAEDRF